jgi:hypothetical protein
MKVTLNGLFYLLIKFHIFQRPLDIFFRFNLGSVLIGNCYSNFQNQFSLTSRTHMTQIASLLTMNPRSHAPHVGLRSLSLLAPSVRGIHPQFPRHSGPTPTAVGRCHESHRHPLPTSHPCSSHWLLSPVSDRCDF